MLEDIVSLINNNQDFVITSHVNPDGDAIGSEIALYQYLKKSGKNVKIINYSETPSNYTFLDKDRIIDCFNESRDKGAINKADAVFILDTNDYSRVKTMAPFIRESNAKKICIDHHLGLNKSDFDYYISDTDSPSTGELLYKFFKSIGSVTIDFKIAEALYTAIMTDTGSFKFPRTDSETHTITADLLGYGVNPFDVYSEVYNKSSLGTLQLLSRFLNNIKTAYDDRVSYSEVLQKDFVETKTDMYATEGFSQQLMSIESVQIGIIFTQTPKGVKISFRSKDEIPVNELSKEFGGGGHQNAAGASIDGADIEKITEEVISKAEKYIK